MGKCIFKQRVELSICFRIKNLPAILYIVYTGGKVFRNYKHEFFRRFFLFWTQNRNHGDAPTKDLKGKQLCFFAEPQYWYTITKNFATGTKLNIYYHLYTTENILQVYPTIAIRLKL